MNRHKDMKEVYRTHSMLLIARKYKLVPSWDITSLQQKWLLSKIQKIRPGMVTYNFSTSTWEERQISVSSKPVCLYSEFDAS